MKKIEKYRIGVQLICLVLTSIGFFVNFKIALLIIMALSFFSGTFYCGWVCPYGFIQDLSSNLGKFLGIKKRKMPITIQKILVFNRYILLILVFLVATDLIFNILTFDPRVNFQNILLGNVVTISSLGVICFFLLVALFFERPFCNYFCYEGAKYGLMGVFRLFTIKRDNSTCVSCRKCDNACPMNIQVSKSSNLRSPQCINCFKCVSSCPAKGALTYGKCSMNKVEKKRYFTLMAVVLLIIITFIITNIYTGKTTLNVKNNTSLEIITNEILSQNLGDAPGIKDGIYTGNSEGFRGSMTVQVTVKNQQIESIQVIDHRDDKKWFDRANNVIPNEIIAAQSTDVDTVSGATYSSVGIINGVKDALEKTK